ncbi:low-density lipoprotein receptor-related protein 11 isoform X2 [Spea bombifrons]|uniref:low-density lipoprotein receptor-related protein 11 isoform X2 n=1 Tax=Spea bombifrons TaxID=233779 RepID=UPI00234BB8B2|nr:low-density lipoprotein receptor-related protein 11 isoform X2 [Spea bombifrons]
MPLRIRICTLLWFCAIGSCKKVSPAPQLTDLKSQISGVEELLEEFGKQLQQERHSQNLDEQKQEEQTLRRYPDQAKEQIYWGDEHRRKDTMQTKSEERTEEDTMQRQLLEAGVRSNGNAGEDMCKFNKLDDYIIRTKDSQEAGATFLKAPSEVYSWKQCLELCCAEASCSLAVVERSGRWFNCFLFDCIHRELNVCKFSPHKDYISYTLSERNESSGWAHETPLRTSAAYKESDTPPHSNAGQDVVLQLPVDWFILDGRGSTDDHAIVGYDWTLLRGDSLVEMKVPQPGTLMLSHLQEGVYTLQLTVTDTSGQQSSDNVSVNVLPEESHGLACTGACTRYQFICDDGCCIDITLACDKVVQCPDGSDEAFCKNCKESNFINSKDIGGAHPAPQSGAVLPLALGLAVTALLMLMVVCRLQLVRQKLKKSHPLTLEESDYLINGMYL